MDLEKLTKLADLKHEQSEITSALDQAWTGKKEEVIQQARQDFESFFATTDFNVEKKDDTLIANYDSINILLNNSQHEPSIKSGPYYLTFELTIDIDEPQEVIYKIPVDKYNSYPSLKKEFRVHQYCSDNISGKIEKIEKSISEIKDMISDFKEIDLGFAIVKDNTTSKNILDKERVALEYNNLQDVLADIFT
ncbi:MAG: hypothetical protein ACQERJ_09050 [Bacillota bacterium]